MHWNGKFHYLIGFLLVRYQEVWSSGQDKLICLYLKITENCVRLNLQGRFWFVYIRFGSLVKFKCFLFCSIDTINAMYEIDI